jgi:predicted nucleic acid-binding Zn ribbon protein
MARRKKRRELELVGNVLVRNKTMRSAAAVAAPPISARDWELAVGTRIAARARPDRLERGVLHVVTASAAWSQELSLLSAPILERLARLGLEVEALRFRVGAVEASERLVIRRPGKHAPRDARLDEPLAQAIAKVEDDELRVAIARAAKRSLGFSRAR